MSPMNKLDEIPDGWPKDTPRTNALMLEFNQTPTFITVDEHRALLQKHINFTRELEREGGRLREALRQAKAALEDSCTKT